MGESKLLTKADVHKIVNGAMREAGEFLGAYLPDFIDYPLQTPDDFDRAALALMQFADASEKATDASREMMRGMAVSLAQRRDHPRGSIQPGRK